MSLPSISSSSNPPYPHSLIAWVQSRVGALLEAGTEQSFNAALDVVLSPNLKMTVNGVPATREDVREHLGAENIPAMEGGLKASWEHCLEVLDASNDAGVKTGLVAGVLHVTRAYATPGESAPRIEQSWAVIQTKVEQDPAIEPDMYGDRRRITHVVETNHDTMGSLGSAQI